MRQVIERQKVERNSVGTIVALLYFFRSDSQVVLQELPTLDCGHLMRSERTNLCYFLFHLCSQMFQSSVLYNVRRPTDTSTFLFGVKWLRLHLFVSSLCSQSPRRQLEKTRLVRWGGSITWSHIFVCGPIRASCGSCVKLFHLSESVSVIAQVDVHCGFLSTRGCSGLSSGHSYSIAVCRCRPTCEQRTKWKVRQ